MTLTAPETPELSRSPAFDAAIVDLDGTLVDTLGDFEAALNAMLLEMGLRTVSRADIAPLVGKGSEHLIAQVLKRVGPTRVGASACAKDDQIAAQESYQRHYQRINGQHSAVYPGALEGMQLLHKRGLKLACLTNKPTAFANALLKAKGLDGFFEHVYGGDSFERKKPDPLPLLKTCTALGTAPARTLMIGDSSNDAQAADAAKCPVVLVTYGYNHGEPILQVPALAHVASLVDVASLVG